MKIDMPYGRQVIDNEDELAVHRALSSSMLTTGPEVERFEAAVSGYVGADYGVAVNSGTAALHAMMSALGIGPGDEVVVPPITFAATANCVAFVGGTPVFADVLPGSLLLDPEEVARRITPRTKAVIAVDYAGQACDYGSLARAIGGRDIALLADGCHALGASGDAGMVGSVAAMTAFSFHPVKAVTTCEGGMVTTDDPRLANRLRRFRNHCMDRDSLSREEAGSWRYDITGLGYNYRLSDVQCALGTSQMKKLPSFLQKRRELAARYDGALSDHDHIRPLEATTPHAHARHIYVVRFSGRNGAANRDAAFTRLRASGIGVNVHYWPVHLFTFYKETFGTGPGMCPVAEEAGERILTLPLHPGMTEADVDRVVTLLKEENRLD